MGTAENPHAGQGMVVLDIGGAIGALIVSAPHSMEGIEIEICPKGARSGEPDEGGDWWQGDWHSHTHTEGEHSHGGHSHAGHAHGGHAHGGQAQSHGASWPHVAVVGRPQGDEIAYAAVYPGLREGEYELWQRPNEPTALTVRVVGASVTQAEWPPI